MTAIAAQYSDDETNAYCGFQGKSGGAELHIFRPAGDTPEQAIGVERATYGEMGGRLQPITVAGADSAQKNLAVPGKKPSAGIAVRRGPAVFTLNIPASPNAREQPRWVEAVGNLHFPSKADRRLQELMDRNN